MRAAWIALGALLAGGALVTGAIVLGGPTAPAHMASISAPFAGVDFGALPAATRFVARDGTPIAFRRYAPGSATAPAGSAVLVHGSSASSASLHVLAQALSRAGFEVLALDIRGHGESGARGRIGYVGQLEDDLEDAVAALAPPRPRTLIGFSSGGGFALRFASDARHALFDGYVLLSPFLSQDAPTQRPDSGGWVHVGLPRYIALAVLNRAGVRAFNDLSVTAFAVEPGNPANLTPTYSYTLAQNFRPRPDYSGDIRAVARPMAVLVGADDEAFRADRFAEVFAVAQPAVPVTVLPGLGHIAMTIDPAAQQAVVATLNRMHSKGAAP